MQTYEIDIRISDVELKGTVLYDEESDTFDFSSVEGYAGHRSECVHHGNRYMGTVGSLLRNYVGSLHCPEDYGICAESGYIYSKDDLTELGDGRNVCKGLAEWSEIEDCFMLSTEGSFAVM